MGSFVVRWVVLGLGFWYAWPADRALGGDPVLTATAAGRLEAQWLAGQDGLLFHVTGRIPRQMSGPPQVGELRFLGAFVDGFLEPRQRRFLDAALSGCLQSPLEADGSILDRLVIVLDPGHGGSQVGALGATGTKEKDIVLSVARLTRNMLVAVEDLKVVMTRLGDEEIDLHERVELANKLRADLFISIHANSFPSPSLHGIETFFHSIDASGDEARRVASAENAPRGGTPRTSDDTLTFILEDMHSAEKLRDSSLLAHLVQDELAGAVPFENRGVMQADFTVLRGTRMPSILIELGFLSNPREERALCDPRVQEDLARAIQRGVQKYWRLARRREATVRLEGASR